MRTEYEMPCSRAAALMRVMALFELSVPCGVVERMEHRLFSDAVSSAASGAMAFGGCEDGLVALSSRGTCFYSGHV